MRALHGQLKSANYQQIVASFNDFSKLIVDNPKLERAIYSKEYLPPATDDFKHKVDWAIGIRFGWFESVVVQRRRYRLLSRSIYNHWCSILAKELDSPAMRRHWARSCDYYHPDLRKVVNRLLDKRKHDHDQVAHA